MNFSEALQALKDGDSLARQGWNGRGMWIYLVNPSAEFKTFDFVDVDEDTETEAIRSYPWRSFIAMKDASGMIVPWLASQTDILADDWELFCETPR